MTTKQRALVMTAEDLQTHTAVREWHRATGLGGTPESIQVLRGFRETSRTHVYRIRGLGPARSDVFAKHLTSRTFETERTVYERILPRLPLTTPRYYGSLVDGDFGWIFLEDVGEHEYSKEDPEHLALAARWVAALHTHAADLPDARRLPDGGPKRYLEHLRSARQRILSTLETWPYPREERRLLASLLRELERVESRWSWIEASSGGAPHTVVHGDFRPKNAYLKDSGGRLSLYPIDWETAGFGPAMLDLGKIHLGTYCALVRDVWPDFDLETVERFCWLGRFLGTLAAIDWESLTLASEKVRARSASVMDLEYYRVRLVEVGRTIGMRE